MIEFGSKQHMQLIHPAYKLTKEEATQIIEERKKDFKSVSSEEYNRAKLYLHAITTKPVATATLKEPLSYAS